MQMERLFMYLRVLRCSSQSFHSEPLSAQSASRLMCSGHASNLTLHLLFSIMPLILCHCLYLCLYIKVQAGVQQGLPKITPAVVFS